MSVNGYVARVQLGEHMCAFSDPYMSYGVNYAHCNDYTSPDFLSKHQQVCYFSMFGRRKFEKDLPPNIDTCTTVRKTCFCS